jgi:hypothetical protein
MNYGSCVECNSKAIVVDDYNHEPGALYVSVYCMDCKCEWVDTFELMGTELMYDGRKEIR